MRKADVIIIGSGIGGVTAARLLAEYGGRRVILLEKHTKFGGMTHVFKRGGQYVFGTGLHYVGLKQSGDFPFKLLDHLADGAVQWRRIPDPYDRFVYPDVTFDVFSDRKTFIEDLKRRFPHEALAIDRFFAGLLKNVAGVFVFHILSALPAFLRRALSPLFFWRYAESLKPAQRVLDSLFTDLKLKAILSSLWGDMGTPPSHMAYGYLALLHWHYEEGASFPIGGPKALSSAISSGLKKHGVEILTSYEAEEILIESGRVVGVRAHNLKKNEIVTFEAPQVISNVGVRNTYLRLLPKTFSAPYAASIAALGRSASACVLFAALDRSPETFGWGGGNVWIFPEKAEKNENNAHAQPGEGFLYLSFPSLKDPQAQHNTVEIISLTDYESFSTWKKEAWPRRDDAYKAFKEKISARILARIDALYPGFSDAIVFRELGTPLTFETFQRSSEGQFYGLPVTPERMTHPLAGSKTPIKGLYLSGQDVFSPGIVSAMLGGFEAMLMALGIRKGVRILNAIRKRPDPSRVD